MVFPFLRRVSALGVLLLLLPACRVLAPHDDLPGILKRGELRVVVRPGFGQWGSPLGEEGADEKLFLRHFAQRLGLDIQWVEAPRHDTILSLLRKGRGDIALRRFSPEALVNENGVIPSATIDWIEDVLVATEDGPLATVEDLRMARLQMPRSLLAGFHSFVPEDLQVETLPEDLPLEKILVRVSTGRYQLTATDSALLDLMRRNGIELRKIPLEVHRRRLVWALRSNSHQLRRALADFVFAEKMLTGGQSPPMCRSYRDILSSRVLRVVMKNSPVTVSVDKGGLGGFEYDLFTIFAREMGLRLQPVIPPEGEDVLDWLEAGYGDLACLHEPAPLVGAGALLQSRSYRKIDLVSVVAERSMPPVCAEDIAGLPVSAPAAISQYCAVMPLDPPPDLSTPRGGDALACLSEVMRGKVYAAIVDSDTAKLEISRHSGLKKGAVLLPGLPLCWFANVEARDLMQRVDRFLRRARKDGRIRQLEQKHFGNHRQKLAWRMPEIPEGNLSPFDQTLRWAGSRYGIDWRLLASLMYEESRFDPDAHGPGGSAGLFQLMPATWKELGVEDPFNPGEAIEAGTRYIASLAGYFEDLELYDRMAMAIASYNVGPRHVFDARALARRMGLDPDRWQDNVETAMLLLDDPEVAREFPAGVCRCRRAVGYTRRILRRYAAYRAEFPPS